MHIYIILGQANCDFVGRLCFFGVCSPVVMFKTKTATTIVQIPISVARTRS